MAAEVREFQVTTRPGQGSASHPVVTSLTLPPGRVVTQVELFVPPGPMGNLGIALAVGGEQALPFEKGTYVITDDDHVVWPLTDFPTAGSWSALTYNTGTYSHTVRVLFLVTVPALTPGAPAPQAVIPTAGLVGTVPAYTPGATVPPVAVTTPTPVAVTTPTPVTVPTVPPVTVPTVPPVTVTVPVIPTTVTLVLAPSAALTVGLPATLNIEALVAGPTPAAPTISVTGSLPPGLTFQTHGDGSAAISGVPAFTAVGTVQVTVTATAPTGAAKTATLTITVTRPAPLGQWQRAPSSTVQHYAGATFTPIATYADSVALAATPSTVYLWTATQGVPSLPQTVASLEAWEHGGDHAYPQFTAYRRS